MVRYRPLVDQHGRQMQRLRLSLTDQCNFRCLYCMPPEGQPCLPKSQHLQTPDLIRLVRIFSEMGVSKIRLTGGEPLLRQDIVHIVEQIHDLPKIEDIALTTNGSLLESYAPALKEAGLKRINLSLDSLNDVTFKRIALSSSLEKVITGLKAAIKLGFPVKVNAVILKGINDHEISDFIDFAFASGIEEMRFIEFMPLCGTGWKPQHVYSLENVMPHLAKTYGISNAQTEADSVAESYWLKRGEKSAKVGLIRTLSKPFCQTCSRLRLSVSGFLQPCLFSNDGISLKDDLTEFHATDEQIAQRIREAVWLKNQENEFSRQSRQDSSLEDTLIQSKKWDITSNPSIRSIGG